MPPFDNSKKLNVGAPLLSRLFVNYHGWMASNQYRFAPATYWFAKTVASMKEYSY